MTNSSSPSSNQWRNEVGVGLPVIQGTLKSCLNLICTNTQWSIQWQRKTLKIWDSGSMTNSSSPSSNHWRNEVGVGLIQGTLKSCLNVICTNTQWSIQWQRKTLKIWDSGSMTNSSSPSSNHWRNEVGVGLPVIQGTLKSCLNQICTNTQWSIQMTEKDIKDMR